MKVKVTATVTLETELFPEDYADLVDEEGTPKATTMEQIIAFETKQMQEDLLCSALGEALMTEGSLSDIKVEKIEEAAPAQAEAA